MIFRWAIEKSIGRKVDWRIQAAEGLLSRFPVCCIAWYFGHSFLLQHWLRYQVYLNNVHGQQQYKACPYHQFTNTGCYWACDRCNNKQVAGPCLKCRPG
jgi:hypothetical protein